MKTIAITSGKGGVGKTSLSSNLAIAIQQYGQNVVLFDADLQLANLDVALGIKAEHNLKDVVAGRCSLRESLAYGPCGVLVAVGGSAIGTLMTAGPKRLNSFFDQVSELADDTDLLIYDTASGLENRVMAFVKQSDETIVVTTPDPTAITDAYATIKVVLKKHPEAPIKLIVNMARSAEEGFAVYGHLNSIVKRFLSGEVEYLGHVSLDQSAADAIRRRKPFVLQNPDSLAAHDVITIARKIAESARIRVPVAV